MIVHIGFVVIHYVHAIRLANDESIVPCPDRDAVKNGWIR